MGIIIECNCSKENKFTENLEICNQNNEIFIENNNNKHNNNFIECKMLFYKTRFLDGEDYYNTYNYYKWDNGQNVIIKQGIYETRRNIPWIYWP